MATAASLSHTTPAAARMVTTPAHDHVRLVSDHRSAASSNNRNTTMKGASAITIEP